MSLRLGLRPVLVCAAALVMSHAAFAQVKIAVVNLQKAVFDTAEITKANVDMQAKFKPRQDDLNNLASRMQQIQQQLQTMAGKLTAQAESDMQAEYQRLQREAQRKQQDLQEEVEAYRNDVLQKSSQKMTEVIKKLADEKGLDLVVDSATTLFVKPTLDITSEAVAAFDKAYPVAAAPPPAAKK
jgi:outer membrane protein